jgi:predicted transcriptional regulator
MPEEGCAVTLAQAMEVLKAEPIVRAREIGVTITGCFAADLMSDVLAFAREGSLLVTGLATDQTVRTAAIKHLVAVIVVEGKHVGSEMTEAARDEGVPVYRTPLSKYETCGLLLQAGLRPYRKAAAL